MAVEVATNADVSSTIRLRLRLRLRRLPRGSSCSPITIETRPTHWQYC
jgi:hypothetical protein